METAGLQAQASRALPVPTGDATTFASCSTAPVQLTDAPGRTPAPHLTQCHHTDSVANS